MTHALVLAYYFPPMGLSGVQRITKFAKYLPSYGVLPTIITSGASGYYAFDETLLEDVSDIEIIRTDSMDPTRVPVRNLKSMPPELLRRMLHRITSWIAIPDNKVGWKSKAVGAALDHCKANKCDVILSTAPPYTSHLAAVEVGQKLGIPVVLDYRDDWVGNPRHYYPTTRHLEKHRALQNAVHERADTVITINDQIRESLVQESPAVQNKICVIPQGFDPDDFGGTAPIRGNYCKFVYAGVFYGAQRPDTFLNAVAELQKEKPKLISRARFRFVGLMPNSFHQWKKRLGELIETTGYLPHKESCAELEGADVLWLTVGDIPGADQISTGKLYEYMGAGKPILALVPEGAAKDTVTTYGGKCVHPKDEKGVQMAIENYIKQWLDKSFDAVDLEYAAQHDRAMLSNRLAQILVNSSGKESI